MSNQQPPPIINVSYITQESPKPKWPIWFVSICLFLSVALCGQCSRWFGY